MPPGLPATPGRRANYNTATQKIFRRSAGSGPNGVYALVASRQIKNTA
jgi:hypothetical protein